jgi:cell division protein FtsB|tara:strand:+ start:1712 stop:1927 length:216 start_codon:yes stop_codon:yes gene_type:complete
MDNIDKVVDRLTELDEKLEELKNEKKSVDEEIKTLEEGLIIYCQENQQSIESVTKDRYNVKRTTGRRLKKK